VKAPVFQPKPYHLHFPTTKAELWRFGIMQWCAEGSPLLAQTPVGDGSMVYPFPPLPFLLNLQDPAQREDHIQKVDHGPRFMPAFHQLPGPRVQMLPVVWSIYISKSYEWNRLTETELLRDKCPVLCWQSCLPNNLKAKSKLGCLGSLRRSHQHLTGCWGTLNSYLAIRLVKLIFPHQASRLQRTSFS